MKNNNTNYDIFISYRRSSYDSANLIATRLKAAGYSVFFDLESLRSGKFNEQLYSVIENCKDFISVLPPNALDRCVNEDDWVRLEICHAMKLNKNIIPVMLNGFTWPNPMPSGMEELCNYHALTSSSVEHFDMAMESLQRKYLTSKPHIATKIMAKKTGIFAVALLVIFAVLYGVFMLLSRDVCVNYATQLANNASYVHIIADENASLYEDWRNFVTEMKYVRKNDRKNDLQYEMLNRIDLTEKNITSAWQVADEEMNISGFHSFLLSLHGINAQEIATSPTFSNLLYQDYLAQLDMIRDAVNDPNTLNLNMGTVFLEITTHTTNSYYAAVLSELSDFPKYSLTTFNQLKNTWSKYPDSYVFGADEEYYENIIYTETTHIDDKLSRYETMLEQEDAMLKDLEKQLDEIEIKIDSAVMSEHLRQQQQNEMQEEIAIRQERVEARKMEVESSRAELDEIDKEYVEIYNELKQKNTLEESDGQWYKWGKIVRMGCNMSMITNSRRQLREQGIYSTSRITPEIAYADINSMLTVYQTYHPESKDYVASAKLFYREVSREKLPYSGVIIVAMMDNMEHPIFKIGDIIVEYDGKAVKNYETFKTLYKANDSGSVKVLRAKDGNFEEITIPQIKDTNVVGFVDLTE